MRHGRRRNNSFEKPWVAYAAIGGVVVVIILALVFYMGNGSPAAPGNGKTGASPTPSSGKPQGTTGAGVTPSIVISTPTPVTIPPTGVYVKVSYLGGFSGTYGVNGAMNKIRDSGDRLYPVENATGTITASFHKEDRSTTHELDVEIWKNGKALTFGKNQTAYGAVSISAAV